MSEGKDEMTQEFVGGEHVSLPERTSDSTYWLIVERGRGGMEAFVVELDGGERSLPVFSFREEAGMFLEWETGSGWPVRETGGGELVSLLYGPCKSVERVVLDTLPGMAAGETIDLTSLDQERFVKGIVNRRESSSVPQPGLKRPVPKPNGRPEVRTWTEGFRTSSGEQQVIVPM